jgi:hypothetical protein
MKILKRLLLVIGFFPVMVASFFRWILTGKSFDLWVDELIEYCNK